MVQIQKASNVPRQKFAWDSIISKYDDTTYYYGTVYYEFSVTNGPAFLLIKFCL